MNKEQIYFNWSFAALFGLSPGAADKFLCENLATIKAYAQELLIKIDYKPETIYRGVILNEKVDELIPHKNFTYLSFSENKTVAESFGDPTETGFGSVAFLGNYGYVIEYIPNLNEILYHNKFAEMLPYRQKLGSMGFNDDTLIQQREVMILQPENPFTNIKINKTLM